MRAFPPSLLSMMSASHVYQNVSSSRGGLEASRSLSQVELRLERALEIVRVSARVMAK